MLNEADLSTSWGRRDHALLILMFNTGGRVQETVDLRASDLSLAAPCAVRFSGEGRKERTCPIWSGTAQELSRYLHERGIDPRAHTPVFTTQRGLPLSRFGVRYILAKYTRKAAAKDPRLAAKRLHPHSMRHSAAIHRLRLARPLALQKGTAPGARRPPRKPRLARPLALQKRPRLARGRARHHGIGAGR